MQIIKNFIKQLQHYKLHQVGVVPTRHITKEDIIKAKKKNIFVAEFVMPSDIPIKAVMMKKFCLPYLASDSKVVEIGSGSGLQAKVILECFPNIMYYAFEPSYELSQYTSDFFKNYNFINMPSTGYQLSGIENNSIDLVHSTGVFVILPQQNGLHYFNESARVLKKGGHLVFDFYNLENSYEGFTNHINKHINNFANRTLWPASYLNKYLESLRFKQVNLVDYNDYYDYRTYAVFQKL